MKTISLRTCNTSQEAALIKGNLENEGIPCFLTNENITTLVPHYNGIMGAGIQIMIFDKDLEKAITIVNPSISGALTCPYCDSENIRLGLGRKRNGALLTILISLIAWIPFGNVKKIHLCKDCKSEFT